MEGFAHAEGCLKSFLLWVTCCLWRDRVKGCGLHPCVAPAMGAAVPFSHWSWFLNKSKEQQTWEPTTQTRQCFLENNWNVNHHPGYSILSPKGCFLPLRCFWGGDGEDLCLHSWDGPIWGLTLSLHALHPLKNGSRASSLLLFLFTSSWIRFEKVGEYLSRCYRRDSGSLTLW